VTRAVAVFVALVAIVIGVLAMTGLIDCWLRITPSDRGEFGAACFTLAGVIAAAGAGVYAKRAADAGGRAALEAERQRRHATAPVFIEVAPSAPLPDDVVGLPYATRKTEEALNVAEGYNEMAVEPTGTEASENSAATPPSESTTRLEHDQIDNGRVNYVERWWRSLSSDEEREADKNSGDELGEKLKSTLGDARAVIGRRNEDLLGLSIPLVNVGGGVGLLNDLDVQLVGWKLQPGGTATDDAVVVASGSHARAFNRNRVRAGGTTRLIVVLKHEGIGHLFEAEFCFIVTDLAGDEEHTVKLTVAQDQEKPGASKWHVVSVEREAEPNKCSSQKAERKEAERKKAAGIR